jgi:hypothetical protein
MTKKELDLKKTKSLLDAIKAETSKLEEEDELDVDVSLTIICPVTNIELYTIEDDKKIRLASHGECRKCKQDFHIDAMKTAEGMTRSPWVVVYCGYTCKECYGKKE